MASTYLIRNVPGGIKDWVRQESRKRKMSQNEFLITLLDDARADSDGSQSRRIDFAHDSGNGSSGIPFRFIDIFAGIGGLRIGLEAVGGRCVFSSEIDRYAQRTYSAWFGEVPEGDIRDFVAGRGIPDHDVLAAGFPCQPFSIAGVSKKNSLGREHGFKDKAQGTLFFHLADIIEAKKPPILLLENVKNLRSHNRGDTWRTIASRLDELGYAVFDQIIDAAAWVPQHRERIFIVGFDRSVFGDDLSVVSEEQTLFDGEPIFRFPKAPDSERPRVVDILESSPDAKYTLSDKLWDYLQRYAEKHRAKGNGFGFGLVDKNGIARTLSARYYKDGSEILIPQTRGKNPRRLTPGECGRLMGFPEPLVEHQVVSDTQAYKQYGNSVVPKVVEAVARQIVCTMQRHFQQAGNGCLLKR